MEVLYSENPAGEYRDAGEPGMDLQRSRIVSNDRPERMADVGFIMLDCRKFLLFQAPLNKLLSHMHGHEDLPHLNA